MGRGVCFDVIITKEKLKLSPRKYVIIEGAKFFVTDLKKNNCVVYASEKKLSSYYGLIDFF